jgi:sugar lactone lactonase YvrE
MRAVLLAALCLLISAVFAFQSVQAARPCAEADYEVFSDGFSFPEGPAFDKEGNLYVVIYKREGDIARIKPDGTTEVFIDLLSLGEGKANGMAYHPGENALYACEYDGKRIIKIDLATKKVTNVVDSYEGKPLNEVNDICLASNGDIYFTDPFREDETTGGRVFCYSLSEEKLYKLVEGLAFPNGLTVSPDSRTLYVGQTVRRNVTAWTLATDGHSVTGEGREVFLMTGGNGPDGIETDKLGNLYISHYGGGKLYYVSPGGDLLGCATGFGLNLTNVEASGDWVYATDAERGEVIRIPLKHFTGGM